MKKLLLFCAVLSVCNIANAQVPNYFSTNGLKAAYLFTGNAKDSSGNGNHGTVTGAALTKDRFGNANAAYSFNGTSDYISIASSSTLDFKDTNFTISVWIKCRDYNPVNPKYIFWRGDGVSAFDPYSIYIYSSQIRFRRDVDPGTTINEVGFPGTTIDTSMWHFIVATYKNTGSLMSLYFDGTLIKQQSIPGTVTYSTTTFTNMIGNVVGGSSNNFAGQIDEIGLWNRVLSKCEIKRLYYSSASLIISNPVNDTVFSGAIANFNIQDVDTATSFQWQVNVGSGFTNVPGTLPYVGATAKTLTINPTALSMNGYLFRCIRNSTSCNDTSATANLVVKPTALNNVAGNFGIDIYPNPVGDYLSIDLPSNIKGVGVQLLNTVGKVVITTTIDGSNKINMNRLPPGIYFMRLEFSDKVIFQKIMKE